ncbi:UDP-glycosyltransferase 88F5-like [Lolium perenne]|uniref:UDP-glycosyltransferase 88F5-like n=1 Tax=Lolium perenne TaxID=4522 RepID=UPI003A9A0D60
MEKTVVLYPGLAVSHFVPMMQLTGALLEHGYAVSVALIGRAAEHNTAFGAVVRRTASSMPSVRPGVRIPVEIERDRDPATNHVDPLSFPTPDPDRSIRGRGTRHRPGTWQLWYDEALGVTKELGIPCYTMYTFNATTLLASIQLPSVHGVGEGRASFKDLEDITIDFFGLPPISASHLVRDVLQDQDPEGETYKANMAAMRRIPEADDILVNTFESLEPRAVAALRDPRCLPGRVLPPVYCVGPLVESAREATVPRHKCLAWLDGQPNHSVVFLCFGSVGWGAHSKEQLREIAVGLENSGHLFLWVVRAPYSGVPDLGALLPDEFFERTAGRGVVVKLWAPQVDVIVFLPTTDVLRHRATGAFVTHCGWSSVLEGVMAGVPMVCWPRYVKHRMKKLLMVGEMGIAAEMVGWQQGRVQAGEVEAKVRLVMECEEGKALRVRAVHKDGAAVSWKDGGSGRAAFAQFLAEVDGKGKEPRLSTCSEEAVGVA